MAKKLVIVESPAKAQTINKYLGSGYEVTASFGHVRDLPSSKIGVDVEHDFEPTYIVPTKSKKVVNQIKKMASVSDEILLATDLDREGEAIAWHILEALKLPKSKIVRRITFDEISKEAILESIKHPRDINDKLVDAQQARRVLDRLVGYNLSPLLWKKIYKGLSAGRVQSVAVRLIVDREREIEKFKADEFWSLTAVLEKEKKNFEAMLSEVDDKRLDKLAIKNKKEAEEISKILEKGTYVVSDINRKAEVRNPYAPFTTSTMQQEAANRLGYSARQTMRLAQGLYEAGLITYMRTDSMNLSQGAVKNIRKYVTETFSQDHLPESSRIYKTKSKHAQEAHEAIRPVDIFKTSENVSASDAKAMKLYDLIWRRAVSSQMKEATLDVLEVKIKNDKYTFVSRGQAIKFKGWLELYPERVKEVSLPSLKVGDKPNLIELKKEQHFTEPPARYSEATLVKALEENGIGRPSTYAPTIATIQDRGYIVKDKGRLNPTKVGFIVNDLLVENFADIMDYGFTAQIEDELDEIAEGKRNWKKVVSDFYGPFDKNLKAKSDSIEKHDMDEKLDEKCPDCKKGLIIKHSRRGVFIGCSGFPDCHYTRSYVTPEAQAKIDEATKQIEGRKCPQCKKDLKIVSGKYGPFIGCSGYPECKYMERLKKVR